VTGIILGDPVQGAIIGAGINMIYLGFISAGGAQMGDPAFAGYLLLIFYQPTYFLINSYYPILDITSNV
ncbi:PTS sugar transporter subunit IIC, partial [Clostridioides difficile]